MTTTTSSRPPRRRNGASVPPNEPLKSLAPLAPAGAFPKVLTPEDEAAIGDSVDESDDAEEYGDEEGDEDEGDEGDEDGEDEHDDGGEAEAVPEAAPEPVGLKPITPRSRGKRAPAAGSGAAGSGAAAQLREQIHQERLDEHNDLVDVLSALNIADNRFKVRVSRELPEYWEGMPIKGTLNTFQRAISEEDLQKMYGGGTFRVLVYGKKAGQTRSEIKYNNTFTIVGDPILPPSARTTRIAAQAEATKADASVALLRDMLDKVDKNTERIQNENRELRNFTLEKLSTPPPKDNSVIEVFKELEKRREDSMRLEIENRRAEREADQRRFDAKQAEDRLRWERERDAEKAARDEANRRHDNEMKLQQQAIQQSREDAKIAREEQARLAQASEKEKSLNTQVMLQMMQSNTATLLAQMQESSKNQFSQMQQFDQMKTGMFTDMLKNSSKDKDPLDQMSKMMTVMEQVREMANPSEPEKDTFEKVRDTVKDLVPTFAGAYSAMRPPGAPGPQQAPQRQVQEVRIAPGSVATVAIPRALAERNRAKAKVDSKAQEKARRAATPERAPMTTSAAVPPPPFKFPTEVTPFEEQGQMLGEDLEMGLQRDYNAQQLYVDVVSKFPQATRDLIKAMPVEQVIEIINAKAPAEAMLVSFRGLQTIRAIHKIITGNS